MSESDKQNPDDHTYAMKIENLQDADSKDKDKKDGVPAKK